MEIPAVVDPKTDADALRTAKMAALVEAELAASGKPDSGRGLEKRTRKAVEEVYKRQFPEQKLAALQEKFTIKIQLASRSFKIRFQCNGYRAPTLRKTTSMELLILQR